MKRDKKSWMANGVRNLAYRELGRRTIKDDNVVVITVDLMGGEEARGDPAPPPPGPPGPAPAAEI